MGVTSPDVSVRLSHILNLCHPHPQPFPHQREKGA